MGQSLPNTFTKKRLGHLLYKYTRMVLAKKVWQLHTHMNLVNIFPKQNKNISTKAVNISASLPLSFWSWIGLVISRRWRSSCLGLVLDYTAYSWAV